MRLVGWRHWPLRAKFLSVVLAASTLPLVAQAVLLSTRAETATRDAAVALLQANGRHLTSELDAFHRSYQNAAFRLARLPGIQEACTPGGANAAESLFDVYVRSDTAIRGVAGFDASGRVCAASEEPLRGRNYRFRT